MASTEFHPHSIEEENIAMPPDFDGNQLAQQHEIAVAQHHARPDQGRRGILGGVRAGAAAERRAIALIRWRCAGARPEQACG